MNCMFPDYKSNQEKNYFDEMEESKLNKYVKINQRFKSERQPYNN